MHIHTVSPIPSFMSIRSVMKKLCSGARGSGFTSSDVRSAVQKASPPELGASPYLAGRLCLRLCEPRGFEAGEEKEEEEGAYKHLWAERHPRYQEMIFYRRSAGCATA